MNLWILLILIGLLVVGGAVELFVHLRNLRRIRVRIHVNGTRGKSSVTRLIAAGLREGGLVTCAKTTGTLPRMILPDGSEYPVFRPASPNIIEQVRIVSTAVTAEAEVLVVECMALQPLLQSLCELKLVRATHGVITNARADHLDVMGPDEEGVARALAGMVPVRGKLFTAEERHLAIVERAAADRASQVVRVTQDDVLAVSPQDMAGFSYVEHEENVALALKICTDLGVDRQIALRGMWQGQPDPGVMTTHEVDFFGRRIVFVNGFAANDPESTERIWNIALERHPDVQKRVAIFNCRADRPDRSRQLGEACVRWRPADHYVLMGSGTYLFARTATRSGLDSRKLIFAENQRAEDIFEIVVEVAGRSCLAMGMANIAGQGLDLVRFFSNRSTIKEAS
ncbi:MAG: poly-gamma-glutamate synthase PgsB [Phycisphaerae bacterium]|nr:poly-gamma-glutamate synthase PgsB [Phycisphaerae bacterium]